MTTVAMRAALAVPLWSAALVSGFAAGIGWWRLALGGTAPATAFGQGLPVVVGGVALAHAASLAWLAAPASLSGRDGLMGAIGLPVVAALGLGALLAAGIEVARSLGRLVSFALYFKADPPPAEADALRLAVALVVAVPLTLAFVALFGLAARIAAPALRGAADGLATAHFVTGAATPAIVLLAILLVPARLPLAAACIIAAATAAALLGVLARRSRAMDAMSGARADQSVLPLVIGAPAFAALGYVASLWAGLP